MGRTIANLADRDPNLTINSEIDVGESIEEGIKSCDVAIDFSAADAVPNICNVARTAKRPLVIGTTGHNADQKKSIQSAAAVIPVVLASNFSIGVNVLFWLTGKATELLGKDFSPEIVEIHHVMKKDAPSGTAKTLAEIIKSADAAVEIPVRSIREGDVVGVHTVTFSGPGEQLELTHRAESRETFAGGALAAAKWVIGKPPGLYSMQDVLGLR